jgi:hypothetical protein
MRTPGKLETLSLAFQSMKLTFFFKPRKLLSV